jgi:hypothetical protein
MNSKNDRGRQAGGCAPSGPAREISDQFSIVGLPMLLPDGEMSPGMIPWLPESSPWWARGAPEPSEEAAAGAPGSPLPKGQLSSWRVVAMAALQLGIL